CSLTGEMPNWKTGVKLASTQLLGVMLNMADAEYCTSSSLFFSTTGIFRSLRVLETQGFRLNPTTTPGPPGKHTLRTGRTDRLNLPANCRCLASAVGDRNALYAGFVLTSTTTPV